MPGKTIRLRKGLSREEVTAAAKETLASRGIKVPEPGDAMPDGTIYAGVSPDRGKPMYATPDDAPQLMTFEQAKTYAADLHAHGHEDWRVPSMAELWVLYDNRSVIDGFNESGLFHNGHYWSSSPHTKSPKHTDLACALRFSDGEQTGKMPIEVLAVRCVR